MSVIKKIETEEQIKKAILYNLIFFVVILYWFFYATYDNMILLITICILNTGLVFYSLSYNKKIYSNKSAIYFHVFLFLIQAFLIIEISFSYEAYTPPFFISFYTLIGIEQNHNIVLFSFYFLLTVLKIIPIKFFYQKIIKMFKDNKVDNYIEYFINDFNFTKLALLLLLFPLVAFVEEFAFRCLLLTVMVNFLNLNIIIAILLISFLFGFSHYLSSKSWLHFISTLVSSIIYFFALIQLGLFYPWLLHLVTNSLALLFFYQNNKKNIQKDSDN